MSKVADVFLKNAISLLVYECKIDKLRIDYMTISKKSDVYTNSLRLLRPETCGNITGDVTQTKRPRPP